MNSKERKEEMEGGLPRRQTAVSRISGISGESILERMNGLLLLSVTNSRNKPIRERELKQKLRIAGMETWVLGVNMIVVNLSMNSQFSYSDFVDHYEIE